MVAAYDSDGFVEGSDIWSLLKPLLNRGKRPSNPSQETLLRAWDAIQLVNSDGIEALYEQDISIDVYIAAFKAVGIPEVVPILEGAAKLFPPKRAEDSDRDYDRVREYFGEFKALAELFWGKCAESDEKLEKYVKAHREDFPQYLGRWVDDDES